MDCVSTDEQSMLVTVTCLASVGLLCAFRVPSVSPPRGAITSLSQIQFQADFILLLQAPGRGHTSGNLVLTPHSPVLIALGPQCKPCKGSPRRQGCVLLTSLQHFAPSRRNIKDSIPYHPLPLRSISQLRPSVLGRVHGGVTVL